MKFDFNEPVDRSQDHSVKYHGLKETFGREDLLPFWIADMDLKTAPAIQTALENRIKNGIYGYTTTPPSYYDAIAGWQSRRNGWSPDPELMSSCHGVVQALAYFIIKHTQKGDPILVFTPSYNNFFTVIKDHDRKIITCSLKETQGVYEIDFTLFEKQLNSEKPKLIFICNPHNPVGRVWTKEELTKVAELCHKYGTKIISDEIHSDIILKGHTFTPMATLDAPYGNNIISCLSASKTFNLAGVQAGTIIFSNKEEKDNFDRYWSSFSLSRNTVFTQVMVEAAFTHGDEWVDALMVHLEGNMAYVRDYLQKHIPLITAQIPESTYLMWLDCRQLPLPPQSVPDFFINKPGLALGNGATYGADGAGFMRFNVACPRPLLEKAMAQLKAAVQSL